MIGQELTGLIDEVEAASDLYEAALTAGDHELLTGLFWHDDRATRIGDADVQVGYEQIAAYRRGRGRAAVTRTNTSRRVIPLGDDVALVDVFSTYPDDTRDGRQSQVWLRTAEGWRVAHAHVSRAATETGRSRRAQ